MFGMNLNVLNFVTGVFFFVCTIILSIVLYQKSRYRKTLTFTYTSTSLYTRRHPDITIAFKGKQIENLSRLRVVMWNSGNQEIRKSDIPAGSEPSIRLTGAKLRSAAILETSPSIQCAIDDRDEQTLDIVFQFLNPGDYAALEVLYESEDQTPKIEYTARIIGGTSDSRRFLQPATRFSWVNPVGLVLMSCVIAYLYLQEVQISVNRVPHHWISIKGGDFGGLVLTLVFATMFALGGLVSTYNYILRRRSARLCLAAQQVFKN